MLSSPVHEPRQTRSRRTRDRFVQAARALLEEKIWDEITIQELAGKAGSSVGGFYARFADKEALLDFLDEQYAAELTGVLKSLMSSGRKLPLSGRVGEFVVSMVAFHRRHRGLVRTLVMRARSGKAPAFDERTRRMNALGSPLLGCWLECRDEIRHPDPQRAVFWAFAFTFSALRDRILFPESVQDPFGTDDDTLCGELTRLALAYLGCGDSQ